MTRFSFNAARHGRQQRLVTRVHALIIYDITDDKRRLQLAKCLQGYGDRVQYSGFEVHHTRAKHAQLINQIRYIIDETDNVRVYKITSTADITILGRGDLMKDQDVMVL
jgi:CRISPR-associated protein Cas2